MDETLLNMLLEEETAFTQNLEAFRDVYVSMVERETVVPSATQQELWPGFSKLVEGQTAFLPLIQAASAGGDVAALYKKKMELCEGGLLYYLGNIPRAEGVLMDLNANNKTWKVYMEGAIMDSKAKQRSIQTFLVMPRAHFSKLLTILSPFGEVTKSTVRMLEAFEIKFRNLAGKPAAEDAKKRSGVPGLQKLKLGGADGFLERPTRRLLREGKFLAQAPGLGKGSAKKKAKENGYWFCDDCFLWGATKGPVKGCVRLKHSQMRVETLDEGGYAVELNDSTGQGIAILCSEENVLKTWENDFNDWVKYWLEREQRDQRDEGERIKYEAEQRKKEEAERIRKMEEQKEEIARQKALEASRPAAPSFEPTTAMQTAPATVTPPSQSPRNNTPPPPLRSPGGSNPPPLQKGPPPSLSSPGRATPVSPSTRAGLGGSGRMPMGDSPVSQSPSTRAGLGGSGRMPISDAPAAHQLPPPVPLVPAATPGSPAKQQQAPSSPLSRSSPSIGDRSVASRGPGGSGSLPPASSPRSASMAVSHESISAVSPRSGVGAPARSSLPPAAAPRPSAPPRNSPAVSRGANSPQVAPRVPKQRAEAPPPWETKAGPIPGTRPVASQRPSDPSRVAVGWEKDPNSLGKAVEAHNSGPRVPKKRAEAPPPWAK